ncbi:permease, partial [Morganella morganii]
MIYTLPWADFFICFTVLFFGYLVFGMVGFGSALISSPVLAFFIPVSHIVPMLALMDLGAAVINVTRDGRKADFAELKWMVPLMIGGSLIGAAILLKTHPDLLAVFLGAFIVLYA